MRAGTLTCVLATATLATVATLVGGPVVAPTGPEVRLTQGTLWLADELTGFQSPSGNIGCYIDPTMIRCDIAARDWTPPPRPPDCSTQVDYGQGLLVRAGGGSGVVCAGDTALGYGEVLTYGSTIRSGRMQCDMSETAMRCRDLDTGHGFEMSRQRYALF